MLYIPNTKIITSERGQPLYIGQNSWSQTCPLFGGSTVHTILYDSCYHEAIGLSTNAQHVCIVCLLAIAIAILHRIKKKVKQE